MASILAGDIRKGSTFEYNGKGVYTVTEFQHVKPGKGAAFVRATIKKRRNGSGAFGHHVQPHRKARNRSG